MNATATTAINYAQLRALLQQYRLFEKATLHEGQVLLRKYLVVPEIIWLTIGEERRRILAAFI